MPEYPFLKVFNQQPGWYSGDFHVHSNASLDGDYPPEIVVGIAKAEGLDFVTLTDHNTVEGLSGLHEDLDFPVIPGIEVTLTEGHFNVFGMQGRCSWMDGFYLSGRAVPLPDEFAAVSDLMQQVVLGGYLNSINHPLLEPWDWQFKGTDLGQVHCIELWNDLYWPDNTYANPKAVDLWTGWLNAGHRITAIGGSDYHYPPRPELGLYGERLGQPTTYVYARNLSVPALLEGIRQRRAYVSRGPQVDFQAKVAGNHYMIGDDIGVQQGEIEFAIAIQDQPAIKGVQVVKNGEVVFKKECTGIESAMNIKASAYPGQSDWFRLEALDKDGGALVITNPIFVN